jgi:hypothetical protein
MKTASFLIVSIALLGVFLLAGPNGGVGHATGAPCPDLDNNGVVNMNDVGIASTYFGQAVPPAPPEVDQNKSGTITAADINAIITAIGGPGACLPPTVSIGRKGCPPADVTKDGFVVIGDIGAVVVAFGAAPPAFPPFNPNADITGDGVVSVGDIGAAVVMFGVVC